MAPHEVHECEFARGISAARMRRMPDKSPLDITNQLDTVHGGRGGAGRTAMNILRKGGTALEKIGSYFGGAVALKEGWDYLRGNDRPQPQAPSQSPQRPAQPAGE